VKAGEKPILSAEDVLMLKEHIFRLKQEVDAMFAEFEYVTWKHNWNMFLKQTWDGFAKRPLWNDRQTELEFRSVVNAIQNILRYITEDPYTSLEMKLRANNIKETYIGQQQEVEA